ncbi:serine/threonine-protein kinase ATM [Humulus lupulus]|uniref:serine/threonine-protein kinase ATM n=1 Tax=Humulus lupulus TaxID=3486 RepID=UPI002B4171D2|nr:serine/threonine-protein kinase ATM [Humulus lupulus]
MENPKTLEAENPDDKTPIQASGLREMGEKSYGLASLSDISNEVDERKDFANNDLGVENVEVVTQAVIAENGGGVENSAKGDEVEKGCLVKDWVDREKEANLGLIGSTLDKENEAEMGLLKSQSDGSIGDLGGNVIEEKVQDEGRSEDKPLGSTEIEVSSGGISLFVEFSGSPGNFMHKDVDVENSSSLAESMEDLKYGNGKQGTNIDNQDLNFSVGDIVWVQTKNQTWWPGKICNPVNAPKYAARTGEGDHLLVGYYGISHFAWCRPSQLKPFHENFEQMKGKNKARIFVGAVEKAVDEFGGHVKLEMTCSCALSRNQLSADEEASFAKEAVKSKHKSARLGEFSVSNFEPVMFLDCLKYLAKVVSLPRNLDFTVTHNQLSAFYLFNGHTQLPMHLLTERNSAAEGKVSGKDKKVFQWIRRCNNAEESSELSGPKNKKMKKKSAIKVEDGKDKKKDLTGLCKSTPTKGTEGSEGDVSGKVKKRSAVKVEDGKDNKKDLTGLCKSTPTKGTEGSVGDFSGKKGMIEKGFDSRERKKSRYLSYPYVSWEQKGSSTGTEDPKGAQVTLEANIGAGQDIASPLNLKCSGEKFWKKWYRSFSGESNIPGSSELISVAPAELLCEIRSAAVDCLHPKGSKKFNLIGWTFSRFRTSVYHDEVADEICPKNIIGQNELNGAEACLSGNNVEKDKCISKPKRTKKKETLKHSVCSPDVIGNGENSVQDVKESKSLNLSSEKSLVEKLKTKPLSGLSDVNISIVTDGMSVKEALEMGSSGPSYNEVKRRRKKKGEEIHLEHLQTNQTNGIPDLNGNSVVSSVMVDDPQVMSSVVPESNLELLMKMEKGALLGNSNAKVAVNLMDVHGNNAEPGTLVVDLRVPAAPAQQDFTTNNGPPRFGLLDKDGQIIGSLSEEGKSVPKKRKKREKAAPKIIPDLNGTNSEFNSLGKDSLETNGITIPMKPERKKRRKKGQAAFEPPKNISFTGRPDTIASYNKAETNGETRGAAALLLTFATGVSMPSREDLISTFCKFGPLKESETQLLKDPGSAQIVFTKSVDAREALQSIEKNNPFGSTLTNYRLHDLSSTFRVAKPNQASNTTTIATSSPMEGSLNPPQAQAPGALPLDFIRQNLQMMTSMLEKSGNNLSTEMRTKLEGEIKGLLNKVSSIAS